MEKGEKGVYPLISNAWGVGGQDGAKLVSRLPKRWWVQEFTEKSGDVLSGRI
jgi:hypothetical protein